MSQPQYEPVSKSIGLRLQELAHGLQVIRDSLQAIEEGRLYQFVPLYGQLRALLSERGQDPLLLSLADELDWELQVFRVPSAIQELEQIGLSDEDITFLLEGFPVTREQETDEQVPVSLNEFLESDIIKYEGRGYSPERIIRFFANKAGGAHYDTGFPKHFADMLSFRFGNQPALKNALKQVAEVILELGVQLLRSQMTCYIHAVLCLREESIKPQADILSLKRPQLERPNVFFGFDDEKNPTLGILSPEGITAQASVDAEIDWNEPHACTLSIEITKELSTRLAMSLGGEIVTSVEVPQILFVLSHPSLYDIYIGHTLTGNADDLEVGVATFLMVGETDESNLREKLAQWSARKFFRQPGRWVYFGEDGYGKSPAGEKDLKTVGDVPFKTLGELEG